MKRKQRISAVFIVICFIMCMMNVFETVSAAETTDITLHCYDEEQDIILSDMHWSIYLLGTLDGETFTWSDAFSQYEETVLLEDLTASELTDFASTLKNYTQKDKILPTQTGISGTDGYVTFTGLSSGMYLLTADKLKIDYRSWKAIPSIITVDASLSDNVVSVAKVRDATKDENETNYAVRKIWMKNKDEAQDERRIKNASITVEIYKNGELFDTKELNAANKWEYSWSDATGAEWYVIEKDIPRYYTVSYRDNITEYVVVNTVQPQYRDSSVTWDWEETTTTETLPPSITDISTETTPRDNSTTDSGTTTTPKTGNFTETTAEIDHSINQTETNTTNETDSSITDISSSTGESSRDTASSTRTTVTTSTKTGSGTGNSGTTKTGSGNGTGSGNTRNSTLGGGSGSGNSGGGTGSGNTTQITKLPQTGQLWWPVAPLACGGILMMGIGMKLGKKEE